MTRPRLSLYSEEQSLFDFALREGGAAITFATHGQAVYFRQRCYKFRKAFAEANKDSVYDTLTLPKLAPDDVEVRIVKREPRHLAVRALGSNVTVADDEGLDEIELEVRE